MSKLKRNTITGIIAVAAAVAGVAIAALVVDIHQDRQFRVRITGQVKVYDRESPAGYTRGDEGVIEVLRPADQVSVMRITFHENEGFESIRVRLRDGREGYIFCCENFELNR